MKVLLKVPIINDKIKAAVREQMIQGFGGNFTKLLSVELLSTRK